MELLRPNLWILYLMGNSGFRKVLFLKPLPVGKPTIMVLFDNLEIEFVSLILLYL